MRGAQGLDLNARAPCSRTCGGTSRRLSEARFPPVTGVLPALRGWEDPQAGARTVGLGHEGGRSPSAAPLVGSLPSDHQVFF